MKNYIVEEIKGKFRNNEKHYDLIYNGKKIINVTVDKEMNKTLAFAILNDFFVKNGFPKKKYIEKVSYEETTEAII